MDNEFLMSLYDRIDRELDAMHARVCAEKYEPTRDPYWEGVCQGIDQAWQAVERIFKEAEGWTNMMRSW